MCLCIFVVLAQSRLYNGPLSSVRASLLKSNQDAVQTRLIKTVNICLVILICASLVEIGLFKGSR